MRSKGHGLKYLDMHDVTNAAWPEMQYTYPYDYDGRDVYRQHSLYMYTTDALYLLWDELRHA